MLHVHASFEFDMDTHFKSVAIQADIKSRPIQENKKRISLWIELVLVSLHLLFHVISAQKSETDSHNHENAF